MSAEVSSLIRDYFKALYTFDYNSLAELIYPRDLYRLKDETVWAAEMMDQFGESATFFRLFPGVKSIDDLEKMNPGEFVGKFLTKALEEIPFDLILLMLNSIVIDSIFEENGKVKVILSFMPNPKKKDNSKNRVSMEIDLICENEKWYVLLNPGLNKISERVRCRVNDFNERKSKDKKEYSTSQDALFEPFCIWGYRSIHDNTITIIEPRFAQAEEFSCGVAPVKISRTWGFIDKSGEIVIKPIYNEAKSFSEELACVGIDSDKHGLRYGYININGKTVIPPKYDEAESFREGVAAVSHDDLWGFIDKTGKYIIKCCYDQVGSFSEGVAAVCKDGLWGYIDKNGVTVLEFIYLSASEFCDGNAEVMIETDDDTEYVYIDRQGFVVDDFWDDEDEE